MNHNIIKRVIEDQHEVIKNFVIINRPEYVFEENMNYILVGLRRSGKSTLLYKRVLDLIKSGVDFSQIIYINFEDDRLLEFNIHDFDDIIEVGHELSNKKLYYFFDEIQNIEGWERFARRMADAKESVYITGSNAKMLSNEMNAKLGGRYLSKYIAPYSFKEYLTAKDIGEGYSIKAGSLIQKALNEYLYYGGLPETIFLNDKREYIRSVYQKILLNDIILHNHIRNETSIKVLVKKIAESVKDELSFTKLHNIIKSIGFSISKDTIIDYVSYILDSYLLFEVKNYYTSFVDKESTPKYYFTDNGVLNLFLNDEVTLLLENLVAIYLKQKYQDDLYYIKSSKTNIDVDFYIPDQCAIQVAYTLGKSGSKTYERETQELVRLAKNTKENLRYILVTTDKSETIEKDGITIEIINIKDFLLA